MLCSFLKGTQFLNLPPAFMGGLVPYLIENMGHPQNLAPGSGAPVHSGCGTQLVYGSYWGDPFVTNISCECGPRLAHQHVPVAPFGVK